MCAHLFLCFTAPFQGDYVQLVAIDLADVTQHKPVAKISVPWQAEGLQGDVEVAMIDSLKTVFLPGTDWLVLACYSSDIVYKEMGRYHAVCEWGKMLKTYCMHCNRQVCPVLNFLLYRKVLMFTCSTPSSVAV